MSGLLTTLFGWPNGICTGNLIASLIWGAPAMLHLHLHVKRHSGRNHAEETGSQAQARSKAQRPQ